MSLTSKTPPAHDGPCKVDLDVRIAGTGLTPRDLAERALVWADGLDEFADLLPLAREALATGRGEVAMDREHFDALSEVVVEFGHYAHMCGYYDDEDDEDRLIARVLISPESGRVSTWLLCTEPVTWTETHTIRRSWDDRVETRELRAMAHGG